MAGASGSGKSVLPRSVAGLQGPSTGQITRRGADVAGASAADRAAANARSGVMCGTGRCFRR